MGYGGKQANRSGDIRRFNFTGNGSNTAFDLGFTPATQNQLIVTVNGLVQHYDAFSISGSTITFDGTPASGDAIQVTAVVDAVGVAAIPDGAVANVSTLTASGAATFSNTTAHTGAATFSSTANVAQGLTANTLTVSTNTATFGTTLYGVANGNIGVGTSSPGCKFEVTGLVRATSLTNPTSGSGIEVGYDGTQGVIQAFSNRVTNTAVPINIQGDLKMNSGYGSSVVAYGCRAWAKFNGITDVIIASGNISSITDTGVSTYRANFTNNLVDANYAVVTAAQPNGYGGAALGAGGPNAVSDSNTNTYVALECRNYTNNGNEPNELFFAVFR